MDSSRLGAGDLIAAASGAALLGALFLPWYGIELTVADVLLSGSANAWQSLTLIDVLLLGVALAAIGVPVARAAGWAAGESRLLVVAGALGMLLVLYRLAVLPGPGVETVGGDRIEFGREVGLVVALVAAAGVLYGGWARHGLRWPRGRRT